jgi:multidrug transporter EmrE-like cation transporter
MIGELAALGAVLVGFVFFHEKANVKTFLGAVVIMVGIALIFLV